MSLTCSELDDVKGLTTRALTGVRATETDPTARLGVRRTSRVSAGVHSARRRASGSKGKRLCADSAGRAIVCELPRKVSMRHVYFATLEKNSPQTHDSRNHHPSDTVRFDHRTIDRCRKRCWVHTCPRRDRFVDGKRSRSGCRLRIFRQCRCLKRGHAVRFSGRSDLTSSSPLFVGLTTITLRRSTSTVFIRRDTGIDRARRSTSTTFTSSSYRTRCGRIRKSTI